MFDDVMQRDMAVKPQARTRAGVVRPVKAAIGFSGVAKLEIDEIEPHDIRLQLADRVQQTHGVDRLPNFQQRITLKPGSSGCWRRLIGAPLASVANS